MGSYVICRLQHLCSCLTRSDSLIRRSAWLLESICSNFNIKIYSSLLFERIDLFFRTCLFPSLQPNAQLPDTSAQDEHGTGTHGHDATEGVPRCQRVPTEGGFPGHSGEWHLAGESQLNRSQWKGELLLLKCTPRCNQSTVLVDATTAITADGTSLIRSGWNLSVYKGGCGRWGVIRYRSLQRIVVVMTYWLLLGLINLCATTTVFCCNGTYTGWFCPHREKTHSYT